MHGRLIVRYEESMAGNILTPTTIWKDFNISFIPSAKIEQEFCVGKKTYTKLYIDGQTIGEEKVEIFATLVKGSFKGKKPAILLLQDFEYGFDDALVSALVDQGYVVLSIDLAGQNEDNQHTVYPEQISYANYKEVANKLFALNSFAPFVSPLKLNCINNSPMPAAIISPLVCLIPLLRFDNLW